VFKANALTNNNYRQYILRMVAQLGICFSLN